MQFEELALAKEKKSDLFRQYSLRDFKKMVQYKSLGFQESERVEDVFDSTK